MCHVQYTDHVCAYEQALEQICLVGLKYNAPSNEMQVPTFKYIQFLFQCGRINEINTELVNLGIAH